MQKKQRVNMVAIGIFIFVGMALLLVTIFFSAKYGYKLRGGYRLYITYDFLDNLREGSTVQVFGGKVIGYVDTIRFKERQLEVVIVIENNIRINRSARFHIYATSLLGLKYINIQGYDPTENVFFEPEESISGVNPVSLSEIFEVAADTIKGLNNTTNKDQLEKLNKVFNDVSSLIEALNKLAVGNTDNITAGISGLVKAITQATALIRKFDETSQDLDQLSKKLNRIMDSVDDASVKQIVKNVETTSSELKALAVSLNRTANSQTGAMKLLNDEGVKASIERTLKNLEDFSKMIKDKPSILFLGK